MSSTSPDPRHRDNEPSRVKTRRESRHTVEVNFALEIRVVKDLHRDLLLAVVLSLEPRVVNGDVFLDVAFRQNDLLVLTLAVHTHESPVRHRDRKAEDQEEEEIGLEPTTVDDGQDALDEPWHDDDEGGEVEVVERTVALHKTDYGRIFDRWGVRRVHGFDGHSGDHGRSTLASATPLAWWLGFMGSAGHPTSVSAWPCLCVP
jgi:hypothetical protein